MAESDFRAQGSSGGLVSWLLVELLERGLVDHVVHVAPNAAPDAGSPLFRFVISSTREAVRAGAKSRYYPVEMSGVMAGMLERPGRYAVVGIPCFIKALRLACRESAVLKERLAFTVGIVCGHLKSTAFAELFAWQCGIAPAELRAIDFRTKLPYRPANSYAVTVTGERDGRSLSVTKPTSELFGSNWGHGFSSTRRVISATMWSGKRLTFLSVTPGCVSRVRCRRHERRGRYARRLSTQSSPRRRLRAACIWIPSRRKKVVESQAGGFRHRRDGLAYRLLLEDQAGRWRPDKRVAPSAHPSYPEVTGNLHVALRDGSGQPRGLSGCPGQGDFHVFVHAMKAFTTRYDRYYRRPLIRRVLGKAKRTLLGLFRAKSGSRSFRA